MPEKSRLSFPQLLVRSLYRIVYALTPTAVVDFRCVPVRVLLQLIVSAANRPQDNNGASTNGSETRTVGETVL